MRNQIIFSGKVLFLALIAFIAMSLVSIIIPLPEILKTSLSGSDLLKTVMMLLLMHVILSIVISYVLIRSNIYGIKLFVFLVWIIFGINTLVMQLDTIIFINAFPGITVVDIGYLVLGSFIHTSVVVPVAMLIFNKWEKVDFVPGNKQRFTNLYAKILILAIIFVIIYFAFGITIPMQFPGVKDFYKDIMIQIQNNLFLFIILQFFRGVLWVIAGLPLFKLFEKKRDVVIAYVLCYSIFSSVGLLLPNPIMPAHVRFAHCIEIVISMALFGLINALVLNFEYKKKIKNTAECRAI